MREEDCQNMAPTCVLYWRKCEDLIRWNEPATKQTSKIECDKYYSGLLRAH